MLTAVICLSISTTILLFWATFATLVMVVSREDVHNQKADQRGERRRHNSELRLSHSATVKYKELFKLHRDKSTHLRQRIFEMKELGPL
jgi:hypothetical protein